MGVAVHQHCKTSVEGLAWKYVDTGDFFLD